MRYVAPFVEVILLVLALLQWTVFVWVILSWILFFASQSSMRWRYRGFYNVLNQLNDIFSRMTHPFLRPFRRFLRRYQWACLFKGKTRATADLDAQQAKLWQPSGVP